jgi:ferredoxin
MNVTINRDACIGCNACVATCPDIFEMDDENKAIVKNSSVPKELEECTKEAAESCPVTCIEIKE